MSARRRREKWFLYILRCVDGTFYTGITKDLKRRLKMHNAGKGARYTRARRPVRMLYHETCGGRVRAMRREWAVKGFSRKQKQRLIAIG